MKILLPERILAKEKKIPNSSSSKFLSGVLDTGAKLSNLNISGNVHRN